MEGKGRGWVTAEYAMLPASTGDRKARDISGQAGRPRGRDPAPDRALASRRRRLRGARRALRLRRLRRAPGRRRHPLRRDHRRLRRAPARACRIGREGRAREAAADQSVAAISVGMVDGTRALRPRLPRGLLGRGRRQRGDDRRRRPGRGPGDGRAHAALPRLARRAARAGRGRHRPAARVQEQAVGDLPG